MAKTYIEESLGRHTIISGQNYGTKITVDIDHSDVDLRELFYAFETIVVGMGFGRDSFRNQILDLADEYNEEIKQTNIDE